MKNRMLHHLGRTLIPAAALAMLALAPTTAFAEEPAGQTAFTGNKCNMCHSIEAVGIERTSKSDKMKAADLSTVGDERDAAWIVQYVKQEVDLEGTEHKRSYKGTDEDLEAIAAWLATLTSPAE